MDFPGSDSGKESACQCRDIRDMGSILGLGRSPGVGNSDPFQYSWLEKLHRQKSLASCSPYSHKESDKTEQLSTYAIFHYIYLPHLYRAGRDMHT